MPNYTYTVLFEPLDGGGYQVMAPAIPEIVTNGKTIEEARAMAQDAIRCFLQSAILTGEAIPRDLQPETERLAVSLA